MTWFRAMSGDRIPLDIVWARLSYGLKRPLYRLGLGPGRLFAAPANSLHAVPPDPWPGNAAHGAAIIQGEFHLAGQTISDLQPLWDPTGVSHDALVALHDFSWLRDLRAAGGDQARRTARELTASWQDTHRSWSAPAWDPDVTGRRLANWLGQYEFFAASADIEFRQALIRAAEQQAKHLANVLPAGLTGARLISAVKGLIQAGVALPRGEAWQTKGLELLLRELERQILPDGGHIERRPGTQMDVLRDLIDIRATLSAAQTEPLPELEATITAMAPVLRLLRHGDGKLALFNGTNEGDSLHIDLALQRCTGPKRALTAAPESGFQRLQAGRSVVVADVGAPPPKGYDHHAHAGTLSFEFSVGHERLVVNCGAQAGADEWRDAQRATAAHSTLTLADKNSAELRISGGIERRPQEVFCRRAEEEGAMLLEMGHDGYVERLGFEHHRSLYVSATGDDLRGEDLMGYIGDGSPPAVAFCIRFHLHPDVKASLTQAGDVVFIGTRKAGGWRLWAQGAHASLADSIYLGESSPRHCQQIVLEGVTEGRETLVKWALRREPVNRT